MIRYCLFTIIALLLLTICAQAQSVKGKVVDATTGNPIPSASVYLNGSSKGTTSDTQGEFILNTTETNIPLVVSSVGYQSEVINNYSNKTLNVRLSPRVQVLREVVIGGMSREEQMKIFLKEFIGSNIKDCLISNPDDINFTYRKKAQTLEADVSQPLIIYNKKLGYKITYFLSSFSHSSFETSIQGNYVFAEDTLGLKAGEVKKILKARDKAYFGSRMHFIRSLWLNDLKPNKFTIARSRLVYLNDEDFGNAERSSYSDLVTAPAGEKFFAPLPNVTIWYDKANRSYVTLSKGTDVALITANGFHDNNLVWSGKIGEQRISELLPFEFEPLEPLSNLKKPEDLSKQVIKDPVFVRMIVKQDSFIKSHKPEKVYVQIDKHNYITGDTIRLKAYLLNADHLTPTDRSGLLYVELDDQEGKVAKRLMLPVTDGLAWADIALDEKDVPIGSYTLRAYTSWMRNFGEDYIYKKNIYVSPASGNATLVKTYFKQEDNKVEAALQFATLDGKVQLLKDMELKVMEGKKNLSKDQLNTGFDGTLKVNFELPATAVKNLPGYITIQAKDVTKGSINNTPLTIPLILNRPENTDIQFMPEGGNLIAGIPGKVGFKAISEDGLGVEVTGEIIGNDQKPIAAIKTSHAGMGSVEFTPKAGESYTAKINGIKKAYALPAVKPAGLALKISQTYGDDSIKITITATPEFNKGPYYLVGQAREIICYAQVIDLNKSLVITKVVPKHTFPTGIARFTIFDATRQPLNERQVFIDLNDQLNINIAAHKPSYGQRDSVVLAIEVKDKEGNPVQGVFSLAVTDDSQVKMDSLGGNIQNDLLLTSSLKGNIEQPGYYFIDPSAQKQAELDNLMLTQGWIGYNWKDIFAPDVPLTYQIEKEFLVKGKATNAFGKPIEKSGVVLLLNRSSAVRDTLTDKMGRFTFTGLFPLDSAVIMLQARNKNGKEFNVGLEVDEFEEPVFKKMPLQTPWYLNTDNTLLKNSQAKTTQAKALAEYKGEGTTLREVKITDKRAIKDSKNLNGPGGADEVLDEDFFHKAGHQTLAELLTTKYKKEFIKTDVYTLKGHRIILIIDGKYTENVGWNKKVGLRNIDEYMTYLSAEDIKGIEIMNSSKYAMAYDPLYIQKLGFLPLWRVPIFLEITTYSGNGIYLKKTPGTYLYRPIPFTLPTQFYSPKYTVKNKGIAMGTDMRSTLHWEPNFVTDKDGKATVSFFTADKPAAYTVIMEGINLDGNIGYKRQKIKSTLTK